jgi:Mrp family chromosome partitioning ATPase
MLKKVSDSADAYPGMASQARYRQAWARSATSAIAMLQSRSARIIGITAVNGGAGVSTFASVLAETYGRLAGRALLVDASRVPDRTGPIGHDKDRPIASTDVTAHVRSFEHVSGLDLRALPQLCDASTEAIRQALTSSAGSFDAIILDLPPARLGATSEVARGFALGPACDGVLMVCESGLTTEPQLKDALQLCAVQRVPVAGLILNDRKLPFGTWFGID